MNRLPCIEGEREEIGACGGGGRWAGYGGIKEGQSETKQGPFYG